MNQNHRMALAAVVPSNWAPELVNYVDNFKWTTGETPMTSMEFLVAVHVIYASTLFVLTSAMKTRETPKTFVKVYGKFHNLLMSILSGVMLWGLIWGGIVDGRFDSWYSFACQRKEDVQTGLVQFSMFIFYLSKILEFVDTFLLVLSKKKLIWLHKVHHLTTMSLVWHAMHINLATDILCAALNCFVHTIMYFYFAYPVRALRSTITFTQITQFVMVLVALIPAAYKRLSGATPCQGTLKGEMHGIIMYGVYLAMFANFFLRQYLMQGKKAKAESQAKESQVRVGGDLLLLPEEIFQTSAPAALRILAKTIALGLGGILCFARLPERVGLPLGILLVSCSMSWLYVVGQDCSSAKFFSTKWANELVGTIALAPLCRPLAALREQEQQRRMWFVRLFQKLFGLSISHMTVYAFMAAGFSLILARWGWNGLFRYYLLPFLAMHLNVGTFSAKGSRSAYELLFPELKNLSIKVSDEPQDGKTGKDSDASKKAEAKPAALRDLSKVPVYNLAPAARIVSAKDAPKLEVAGRKRTSLIDSLWACFGARRLSREMLLWRNRDLALHIVCGVVATLVLHPGLKTVYGPWATVPFLALFLLSLPASRTTLYANRVVSNARRNARKQPAVNQKQELLIEGRIYDISNFAARHPGGRIINFGLGTDSTAAFIEFHSRSKKARAVLKSLPNRAPTKEELEKNFYTDESEILKDFAALRAEFVKEGKFNPSIPHVIYRIAEVLVMHAIGFSLILGSSKGWYHFLGLLVLGLAQGRCGWLMHEGGHYSLTGKIGVDKHLQMAIYGLGCGMSGAWWRNQHNKHHATPQKLKHDVDLDTLPFVAFHRDIAAKVRNPILKTWLRFQAVLFAPVSTMFVTLGWQLFLHPRHVMRIKNYTEMTYLIARYVFWAAVVCPVLGLKTTLAYYLFYVYVGGTYIFINFSVSHTHREVTKEDEHISWVRYSSDHTTNCTPSLLCNWWMSYLNFQIEHHLFPNMPQFNHPTIAPRVKALFEKHGLVYDVRPYWTCMYVTFKNLWDVGHAAGSASEKKRKPKEELNIILHGKILDVSNWMHKHPGGAKVLRVFKDRDATDQFIAFHSPEAVRKLNVMLKAAKPVPKDHKQYVDPSSRLYKLRTGFEDLRLKLEKQGLFKANPLDEVIKVSFNLALYALGIYILTTTDRRYLGAFVFAFAMQQSGWAGHDFSHHSVFASPSLNNAVAKMFAWFQGYELMWWKARHNTHHVVTNELSNDPDIKTAPLLTYMHKGMSAKSLNWIQQQQHIYFIPALGLLHLYWRLESIFYIALRLPKMIPDALLLSLNYVGMYYLFSPVGIGPLAFCFFAKGMMTGMCVFSTHYGEERLPKNHGLSFVEQTSRTSRNIAGGWLMNKFSGHISLQVEHHLFPMMPTANYTKARPIIKEWLTANGLPYNEDSLVTCMKRNIDELRVKPKAA